MSTNQYFGVSSSITSGTSGCDAKGFVQNDSSGQILYAEQNLESLTEEMAAGAGERLVAFSQVMGCAGTQGAKAFADMTREKFSSLVPSAEISAENLVKRCGGRSLLISTSSALSAGTVVLIAAATVKRAVFLRKLAVLLWRRFSHFCGTSPPFSCCPGGPPVGSSRKQNLASTVTS